MQETISVSEIKCFECVLFVEAEMSRYWIEVQDVVGEAESREREGDYQAAFDCYKAAVAQLLQGVQSE